MIVEKLIFIQLVKKFTEYKLPDISLPLTQQFATCPYLEPEESNSRKNKQTYIHSRGKKQDVIKNKRTKSAKKCP